MTVVIQTPSEITDILYQGELDFSEEAIQAVVNTARSRGEKNVHARDLRQSEKGVVTVGRPLCLGCFGTDFSYPKRWAGLSGHASHYLLLLTCSFRSMERGKINFAALTVYMRSREGTDFPIALDMYPRDVYKPFEREFKISIGPKLKFAQAFEGSLGNVEIPINHKHIEPVVVAVGVRESNPGWEFESHPQYPLYGSKDLYMIVEKPSSAESIRMTLDFVADVQVQQGRVIKSIIPQKERDRMSLTICG